MFGGKGNTPIFAARFTKKHYTQKLFTYKRSPTAGKISTGKEKKSERKKMKKSLEVKMKCAYLCSPV